MWTFEYRLDEWNIGVWDRSNVTFATIKDAAERAAEWLVVNEENNNPGVMVRLVKL